MAERRVSPPWKPPSSAITLDTSPSKKDMAREAKLRAVQITPQDHAMYCDIPFASVSSVHQEIVENLTLQTATAAGVSLNTFSSTDFDRFRRGGKALEGEEHGGGASPKSARRSRNCVVM